MKILLEQIDSNKNFVSKLISEFPHLNHYLAKQKNIDVFQRFSITNANTLEHSLFNALKIYQERPLFGHASKNEEGTIEFKYEWSYGKVLECSLKLSNSTKHFFDKMKINGDKIVAICAENSVEWMLCEFSCVFNNFVVVGIHTEWEVESTAQFFAETNIKVLFCDSKNFEKIEKVLSHCSENLNFNIEYVVLTDKQEISTKFENKTKILYLKNLIEENNLESSLSLSGIHINTPVIENENKPNLSDLKNMHTLIFSSGSTGKPKLIIKSDGIWKKNHIDECIFVTPYITASFLPLSHGFDRLSIFFFCFKMYKK